MTIRLLPIETKDLPTFKHDMQEAFQLGAMEGDYAMADGELILPEEDIDRSLHTPGAIAYKAVDENQALVGGAVVVIDAETQRNSLDFLYVRHDRQGEGIGQAMWFEIERLHPATRVWMTCTPYFEKRNIHFYVNVCHFHIVAFYNIHHPDPHFPEEASALDEDGMFGFEKQMEPRA